jgi:hypothetical protein
MICLKRKNCEKIINHLIQEYHSNHRKEAKNQIGKVSADHISRGWANSTVVVNGKLSVEYSYIDKLVDFLFQSMEKDFPTLSLEECKDILINVIATEYKKLLPCANNWLREANLLQHSMLKQYETGIHKRLEETKKNIENRCELSSEKQKQKKWWHDPTNQWIVKIAVAVFAIIITIIGWFVVGLFTKPEPPNLSLYFTESVYKGTEIGVTGPYGKKIYSVPLRLTLVNSTNRTAEDAGITFVTYRDITITSNEPRSESSIYGSGETTKRRIYIPLDAINPTGFGKPSNCNAELKWYSISNVPTFKIIPPFTSNEITNKIHAFVVDGEITAKDMPAAKVKLKISIGTRNAFNATRYKGEIFEINDKGELAKTAL